MRHSRWRRGLCHLPSTRLRRMDDRPLARIKVDEKHCIAMIEWNAVREAASRFLLKHTAAAWKHRKLSYVEQEGLLPMPKDRGAEQGDVDGSLECSPARGMVAAETRGTLPWIGCERSCRGTASASRPRGQNAGVSQLPAWWPRKSSLVPTTRSTRCRKAEAWRINGTWVTATSCVTHLGVAFSAGLRLCQCQSR